MLFTTVRAVRDLGREPLGRVRSTPRLDLHGAFLRRLDFSEFSMRGANLAGADLSNASLQRADLKGADLRGTVLRGTDLTEVANLTVEQLMSAVVDDRTRLPTYIDAASLKDGLRGATDTGAES
ncbi:pentapeptide repeat-containing protein [Salinarimonas chemoclinalis]|uniref:pentapeptide repeat-containing protein n=1 Tax=Salinarimonas chemoclinalis TaxID=3241599 RepID=UPI003556F58F